MVLMVAGSHKNVDRFIAFLIVLFSVCMSIKTKKKLITELSFIRFVRIFVYDMVLFNIMGFEIPQ